MRTYKPLYKLFPLAWKASTAAASLVLLLGISSPSSHADTGAIKLHFVSEEILSPIGPPERIWMSGDVQHIRNFPLAGPVWGDINGTLTTYFNVNLNLTTGDGTAFGIFILEVEWNGLRGTFEGRAQANYEGFVISGHGSGHGTGDFEGMQMQAFFFQEDGRTPLIGTILIPGGE